MQQTILALAAILIFSLYTLSRHEADAGNERISITSEVQRAATGLARARLHEVARRAFDEADVGRDGFRSSTSTLTPRSAFGADLGETDESSYDDLDDFHGQPSRPVTATRNGQTLAFRDSVSVRYLDPANPASSPERSLAKEITVFVHAEPSGYIGTPPVVARLRRVITPASGAAHSTD